MLESVLQHWGHLAPRSPCTAAPGSKHNLYVCKDWTVKRQNANNASRPYPHNGFAAGMLVSFFMLRVYSVPVAARLAGYILILFVPCSQCSYMQVKCSYTYSSDVRVSKSVPVFTIYLHIATTSYVHQIKYRDFLRAWVHLHLLIL